MITSKANVKLLVYKLLRDLSVKSVRGYVTDYRVKLSELVADNLNGDMTPGAQANAHRALLREFAEATFVEGMVDSGQFENEDDARASLDREDKNKIRAWLKEQESYTREFAEAVTAARLSDNRTDAENERAQMGVLNRVDLWGASLDTLGSLGRASGQGNVMVTWKYGDTDHCGTCYRLNGQRHRVKWFTSRGLIPRENGSEALDCGGWNCMCRLVNDAGEVVL